MKPEKRTPPGASPKVTAGVRTTGHVDPGHGRPAAVAPRPPEPRVKPNR